MSLVIIFFLGFILAVVIGQKLKINCGFFAIALGFIITWLFGGENSTSNAFIKAFPCNLILELYDSGYLLRIRKLKWYHAAVRPQDRV